MRIRPAYFGLRLDVYDGVYYFVAAMFVYTFKLIL